MHKKYKEDIKHVDLDGVSVQRILKNHCQGNEKYPVPLVFSPSFEIPMLSEVWGSGRCVILCYHFGKGKVLYIFHWICLLQIL